MGPFDSGPAGVASAWSSVLMGRPFLGDTTTKLHNQKLNVLIALDKFKITRKTFQLKEH
jgi:hypothetical protein